MDQIEVLAETFEESPGKTLEDFVKNMQSRRE
jgi:hypothetical protein